MKVYFAADHAGFELKGELLNFVRGELGLDVEDCGAETLDPNDDYPAIIARAANQLSNDVSKGIEARAILIGASGQGEAMVANRFPGVRAAVFYGYPKTTQKDSSGEDLDLLRSTRRHNDANALSIGARFLSIDEAKEAVKAWFTTPFFGEPRHLRRIHAIDQFPPHA